MRETAAETLFWMADHVAMWRGPAIGLLALLAVGCLYVAVTVYGDS